MKNNTLSPLLTNAVSAPKRALIVADGLCPQIAKLLPAAQYEVVRVSQTASPLASITEALQGQAIDTLHLLAHGRAGALQICGQWINAATLITHASELSKWQVRTIALWSCNVGADRNFVALLEELTGARTWSSNKRIGRITPDSEPKWKLSSRGHETSNAAIEAPFHPGTLLDWPHILATATFSGLFAATTSYDPSTFFGEETSRVDINTSPISTNVVTFSQNGNQFTGNNVSGVISYVNSSNQVVTITGLASRPVKVNGVLKGFYAWIDNAPAGSSGASDAGYIISVDNSYFQANTAISSSSDPVSKALNSLVAKQSSGIAIDNPTALENGSFVVFTLTNSSGAPRNLGNVAAELGNGANGLTAEAADFSATLIYEYSTDSGQSWSTTKPTSLATGTSIQIRLGPIFDDALVEGDEYISLSVDVSWTGNNSATVSGTGTIQDNDAPAIAVTNPTVNEASPYAVFTVTGTAGQTIALALGGGTATGSGTDYGSATATLNLQYSLDGGTTWLDYSTTGAPTLTGTSMLVRTPVVEDSLQDNGETFTLTATPTGGSAVVGTATINDQGGGTI
jgi:hypothetical protein